MLMASDADNELEMMMRERLPMAPLLRFKMNRVRHVPGEQLCAKGTLVGIDAKGARTHLRR